MELVFHLPDWLTPAAIAGSVLWNVPAPKELLARLLVRKGLAAKGAPLMPNPNIAAIIAELKPAAEAAVQLADAILTGAEPQVIRAKAVELLRDVVVEAESLAGAPALVVKLTTSDAVLGTLVDAVAGTAAKVEQSIETLPGKVAPHVGS